MKLKKALRSLWQPLINRLWYVHPPVVLLLQAAPSICLHTLASAAKPSTERLHLRHLFTDGRRYYLAPTRNGFQMRSSSKIPWRRRARTRYAAVMSGEVSEPGAGQTRIQLRMRMTAVFFFDIFILPGWMGALLIFGPLRLQVGLAFAVILLALSWLWHWYTAVLQATEMVYFVQVALEELALSDRPVLAAATEHVVYSPNEFQTEWEKFYEQQRKS